MKPERLASASATGGRVALWGSGSKAVAFLHAVGEELRIDDIVDVNPFRHGLHLPGSGRVIVSPDALRDAPPELVVVMNPIYADEIAAALAAIGVDAELAVRE